MVRLTPNVLLDAPSYTNPEGARTLVLRNLSIPLLENLSVIGDINEVIDLTDNDLVNLGNFPPSLIKLKTLLVANNRIITIQDDFPNSVSHLESLSLISNNINSFNSLLPLKELKYLNNLSLIDNPIVSNEEDYRLFIIWLFPNLKILDFQKIKDFERDQSISLYGKDFKSQTNKAQELLQLTISSIDRQKSLNKTQEQVEKVLKKLTDEDKQKLKLELKNATSLVEIDRIENALRNGYI
ncbi:hypothetical protein WICMUC_005923 [Wickerhamomyces mucosus]|uniref:U2 small nuclear ribonucleoprotein A' n=1 Tax=Wickerhamomyces mucosus TaxID=1378264 RepID=A0A9P8T2S7_9ASCO|nr:hypothetical protein WICMUC_005923 [Wickerhamomyces mucosus]